MTNVSDQTEGGKLPESLGDYAYREIQERLIRGAYPPGYKLTVRGVATDLQMGTTPVREALNRLTADAVLVHSGPKTVIVPVLDAASLREITLTRLALEGMAAEQATAYASPGVINQLIEIQEKISKSLDQKLYSEVLRHNKEFHFTIYGLAGLPNLIKMIETLWLRIGSSLHDLYPEFAETRYGVHNHLAAIEGLNEGDAASVRAAIENDIRDGYRRLKKANPR